jgi:monomeric isocitrate dehydrogenase
VAPVTVMAGGTLWDVGIWDVDPWSGATVTVTNFLSVNALGRYLAVHMTVNVASNDVIQNGTFDLTVFDEAVFDASLPGTAPILQVNTFNAIMEMGGLL